jgi:uncharacterized protein
MPTLTPLGGLVLLYLIATCGCIFFRKFNLPTPLILGSITAVALGNLAGIPFPPLPASFDTIIQVIIGFYLGLNISRENIEELKAVLFPAVLVAVWSVGITFVFGYLLHAVTDLDLATTVLSSSPGGAPEVSIIALAVGANVAIVTVMQVARLLAVVFVLPLLVKKMESGSNLKCCSQVLPACAAESSLRLIAEQGSMLGRLLKTCSNTIRGIANPGLGLALAGGLLFKYFNVPAGGMIGAMAFMAIAGLSGMKIKTIPEIVKKCAYIGAGILIGLDFTRSAMAQIAGIYGIVLLLTALMLISSFILALILHRTTGWRMSACLLSSAPGGLFTMTTMADSLGSDPVKVSLLHVARLIAIKATLPLVIAIIA